MNIFETRSFSMKSSTLKGSNSRATTPLAPFSSPTRPQPLPPIWATGMATRLTSSGPHWFQAIGSWAALRRRASRLSWVSIAPLGRPVVPEV
jgi:hypothetical protein